MPLGGLIHLSYIITTAFISNMANTRRKVKFSTLADEGADQQRKSKEEKAARYNSFINFVQDSAARDMS
eukprot:15334496-Ditylum_brightwellii.AAC.1